MQSQASVLEQSTAESGWRIVSKQERPEWCADEIWELESIWSPLGRTVWITFLVDPQIEQTSRKKGQAVWAAAISSVSQSLETRRILFT
jgi:hypothetical protein